MSSIYKLIMEYNDIKYNAPVIEYPDGFVFDEEKSVKWNREKLKEVREEYENYMNSEEARSELDFKLSEKRCEILTAICDYCSSKKLNLNIGHDRAEEIWKFSEYLSDDAIDYYCGEDAAFIESQKIMFVIEFLNDLISGYVE